MQPTCTDVHTGLAEADVCDSAYQLVFLRPEALLSNETWRDMVQSPVYQENLVAVIIDEFYQRSCHVTLGSNVTNYIPLWNENLAHVTRRIFPSLPPPPSPRACVPRGKIRMACETNCNQSRLRLVQELAFSVNLFSSTFCRQYMNRRGGFNRPLDPIK